LIEDSNMSMVSQEVEPREKRELTQAEERTEAGKFFSPYTDIHENDRAVIVSMEVPGVDKGSIDLQLEKGVLTVKGTVDGAKYASLRPIYSEYAVGSFVRTFAVSTKIDAAAISANVVDGVLTVELPKAKEALVRRIAVN
jgi:HSP20 family molecular chaperone IbpA